MPIPHDLDISGTKVYVNGKRKEKNAVFLNVSIRLTYRIANASSGNFLEYVSVVCCVPFDDGHGMYILLVSLGKHVECPVKVLLLLDHKSNRDGSAQGCKYGGKEQPGIVPHLTAG